MSELRVTNVTGPDGNPTAKFNGVERPEVPPGAVLFFAATTPPPGFLKANGATISRSVYAKLFAAVGTTFGSGDGSTTFTLPDMRGEFPRGWDDSRGVDSGRALGSAQGDAIRNITGGVDTNHSLKMYYPGGGNFGAFALTGSTGATVGGSASSGFYGAFNFDASRQVPTASENRPRNIALLACIKF